MGIFRDLLDLLYPRNCGVCGGPLGTEARLFCWECLSEVTFIKFPFCRVCGEPVEGKIDSDYTCYLCSGSPRFFDEARSASKHDLGIRKVLKAFKYRGETWLQKDLVLLLYGCFQAHFPSAGIDFITCVPAHPLNQRQRGYNQAQLLASGLARKTGIPYKGDCLRRDSMLGTQTRLTAKQRARNVTGAFSSRKTLQGEHVLLVDDVMTTGSTVSECAKILKESGAGKVRVLTVARR